MGVIVEYLINGASPVTVGGTGTTIKYFGGPPGANLWNAGAPGVNTGQSSNQRGFVPSATTNLGALAVPGNNELNGQLFTVRASGNILFGAGEASTTGIITLALSNALATAPPNYQTLNTLTLTNQANDSVYYPWTIAVDLQGDTFSGILQAWKTDNSMINGVAGASGVSGPFTGINFVGLGAPPLIQPPYTGFAEPLPSFPAPAFFLVVGVTWGVSNALNTANMYEFQVELF